MREGRAPEGGEDLWLAAATPPGTRASYQQHPTYISRTLAEKILFVGRARTILQQQQEGEATPVWDSAADVLWERLYRALVCHTAIFSIVCIHFLFHLPLTIRLSRLTHMHQRLLKLYELSKIHFRLLLY